MNILVTGATGYVGQALAFRLAGAGHTVHALCRSPDKAAALSHENIRVFLGDIEDRDSLARAAAGCRQAFHAAALVSVWARDPETYRRVNVGGTLNVVETAVSQGVERVVVTSTAGVFGPSDGGLVDEQTERKVPYFNAYESSKAEMHSALKDKAKQGFDVVIVCPTRIYGPGPPVEGNAVTRMVQRYLEGRWRALPGDGGKSGNYVYIEDVIDGHLAAMAKGRSGEAYILGGDNVTYRDFFTQLAEVSGRSHKLYPVPIQALMAFAWSEEKRAEWFGRKPLITPSWVRRYNHDWANSSAKAMSELGYGSRRLRDGLALTVAWLGSMARAERR
ncbi:MAG TPA: SDR family oxidoreductase [Bauldia sp.]|nr:SDR family oxidoreductase [Bauldia sp.]